MDVLPIASSLLAPAGLLPRIAARYGLPVDAECRLLARGVSDHYLVPTHAADYVLRVVAVRHRTVPEVI